MKHELNSDSIQNLNKLNLWYFSFFFYVVRFYILEYLFWMV